MADLHDLLRQRTYPGRGCVAARLPDGRLYLGYFLTGRSPASRSRSIDVQPSGDVQVRDTSGKDHDSLRHYVAALRREGWTVVGNGEQVEPLATSLAAGMEPLAVWAAHTYEPDPPIFTPRIWLAVRHADGALLLGSASRSARPDGGADRLLWSPEALPVGAAVLVTTYKGSIKSVQTSGLPVSATTSASDPEALLQEMWTALDPTVAVGALVAPADDLAAAVRLAWPHRCHSRTTHKRPLRPLPERAPGM